jgi:TusA-related sulfurtransferase
LFTKLALLQSALFGVLYWKTTMQIDKEIDTSGLSCPLPILRTKTALSDMQSGQTLKIISTDIGSLRDFQAYARQTGNELLDQQTIDSTYIHILRRR